MADSWPCRRAGIGEVCFVLAFDGEDRIEVHTGRLQFQFAGEEAHGIGQEADGNHVDIADDTWLPGASGD